MKSLRGERGLTQRLKLGRLAATAAVALAMLAAAAWPVRAMADNLSLNTPVSAGSSAFTATGNVSASMDSSGTLINLPQAQAKYPSITGAGYTIAILDSGINATHPALAGRYLGGWNFVNNTPNPTDDNGHGTLVAGIAVSNDPAHPGVAPGANYVDLKVLDSSANGDFGNINQALAWVIANRTTYNIVSVNMSFGGGSYNVPTTDILSANLATLKNSGVFLAAATGNNWYSQSPDPPNIANPGIAYPAADPSVVSVADVYSANFGQVKWGTGAINYITGPDVIVAHASRSATMPILLAPGAITTGCNYNWDQPGASLWSSGVGGTSMATPVVAGAAILIRQAIETEWNPSMWPTGAGWEDTILQILQMTGTPVTDAETTQDNVANLGTTFERIDVLAALDYVAGQAPEPATLALLGFGVVAAIAFRRRHRLA
jgi:subtilisin family serine protease